MSWATTVVIKNAYWQITPNWKKLGFRNWQIYSHFHRVTRWGHVT